MRWGPLLLAASRSGRKAAVVTPGPTELNVRGVVCLTAGDITIRPAAGPDLEFVGVPAGFIPPYSPIRRVTAATATVATIED